MARELLVGDDGTVRGVSYVDKATRAEKQIRVPRGGGGSERVRIGAAAAEFEVDEVPRRAGQRFGQVGRNLTDTVGYALVRHVPALEGMPRHNCDGIGGMHVYVPWWELEKKNKDFPRGYHIEIGGRFRHAADRIVPGRGGAGGRIRNEAQGRIRQYYGSNVSFAGRGEMIPNEYSYCEIDPRRWISGAFRCCASTGNGATTKSKMVQHMHKTFKLA
jgi:hypothetical protein